MKRGELRKNLDVERVVDLIHGPVIYRLLITGDVGQLTEDYPQSTLDILIPGLAPRPPKRSRG
jgi:hypothetical protein